MFESSRTGLRCRWSLASIELASWSWLLLQLSVFRLSVFRNSTTLPRALATNNAENNHGARACSGYVQDDPVSRSSSPMPLTPGSFPSAPGRLRWRCLPSTLDKAAHLTTSLEPAASYGSTGAPRPRLRPSAAEGGTSASDSGHSAPFVDW